VRFVFETVGAVSTRYLIAGQGPGVILLHGVGLSADSWLWTAPGLARRYKVVAPDLLDNGFTGAGDYTGGPPQAPTIDHILALADHLKFQRFSLIGSSLGAAFALLTYFAAPDRIDRIVLVGPSFVLAKRRDGFDMFEGPYRNGLSALENPTQEGCRSRMAHGFFDPAKVPDELVTLQMLLYALPGARQSFERRLAGLRSSAARKFDLYDRLDMIGVPVLLISGDKDIRGSFAEIEKGARRIPGVQLRQYDRCGHWPHLEYPDRFNNDIGLFLGA
jgi:2-hydroxy-6-oxonona-2,4-dienedioate hydrolase